MVLSDKVLVKSSKYYSNIGYDISQKYIEIQILDLPHGSHVKIKAGCDYCINTKEISYKEYNKNTSINGKYSCCIKCGCLKSKETNLEKYGVESTNQLDSTKEKSRKTIKEKYGVDHISQVKYIIDSKRNKMLDRKDDISKRVKEYWNNIDESEILKINEKRSITNLEKYGFEHVSQVKKFKDKTRETNLEKWGGYTYQSNILMDKVTSTNLERYGATNSSSSEIIKNKVIETNLERYGDHPSRTDGVKNKQMETVRERYGSGNIMLSEDFRRKFDISKEINFIKYIGNRNYEFFCNYCTSPFTIDYDNYYKRGLRNVNRCTNCFPISENSSIKEIELRNFISENYKGEIISNYRDELEIDIFLPELNIGFEFNGLYWHSNDKLDKNYHKIKLDHFGNRGIRIYNIWEDNWDFQNEIIKGQIKNWIGYNINKIWARSCSVVEINDSRIVRKFLDDNHIQGYIRSSVKIALFHEKELVSIMTFDNFEGRKKMEENGWNLSRFCSKKEVSVIGGASKLLSFFIKNHSPNRVISFADMDWSDGNVYYKLGFSLSNTLKPDYKYIVDHKRINKQRFTKEKLKKLGHDTSLTESKITEFMGFSKIYGCGQLKFELLLK